MTRTRIRRAVLACSGALTALLVLASAAQADVRCRTVQGGYDERAVPCAPGESPVDLCIEGEYRGDVRGTFRGAATSLTGTADTPETAVLLFTSHSVVHATVSGRAGALQVRNAGAFQSAAPGAIVDVQVVLDGDGGLADVTGTIRASGTFDLATGTGSSSYTGEICLP